MRPALIAPILAMLLVLPGCAHTTSGSQIVGTWSATATMPLEGRLTPVVATVAFGADGTVSTTEQARTGGKVWTTSGTWKLQPDGVTVYLRLAGSDSGTEMRLEDRVLHGANGVIWHKTH